MWLKKCEYVISINARFAYCKWRIKKLEKRKIPHCSDSQYLTRNANQVSLIHSTLPEALFYLLYLLILLISLGHEDIICNFKSEVKVLKKTHSSVTLNTSSSWLWSPLNNISNWAPGKLKNQTRAVSRAPQVKERHCGNVFSSGEKKKVWGGG